MTFEQHFPLSGGAVMAYCDIHELIKKIHRYCIDIDNIDILFWKKDLVT